MSLGTLWTIIELLILLIIVNLWAFMMFNTISVSWNSLEHYTVQFRNSVIYNLWAFFFFWKWDLLCRAFPIYNHEWSDFDFNWLAGWLAELIIWTVFLSFFKCSNTAIKLARPTDVIFIILLIWFQSFLSKRNILVSLIFDFDRWFSTCR